MGGGDVAVTITNRDIYDKLVKVEQTVSAMAPQAGRIDDHETRIRSVERWKYALPVTIILSVALAIIPGVTHG